MFAIETCNPASTDTTTDRVLSKAKPGKRYRPVGYGYHDIYEPTPEEIAIACKDIRAKWSHEECANRKAFNPDEPQRWTAPLWRDPAVALL